MDIQKLKILIQQLSKSVWGFAGACLLVSMVSCGGGSSDSEKPISPPTNELPTISIITPSDGTEFFANDIVSFSAEASDIEDGDLGGQIEWASDVDGVIGSGKNIAVEISQAVHQITATVRDSGNQSVSETITISVNSNSGVATLSWNGPTENTDNTQLTDLAGFIIYYGESATELNERQIIDSATVESAVIYNLKIDTTYYFAVSAYNELQVESQLSEVVAKSIIE